MYMKYDPVVGNDRVFFIEQTKGPQLMEGGSVCGCAGGRGAQQSVAFAAFGLQGCDVITLSSHSLTHLITQLQWKGTLAKKG